MKRPMGWLLTLMILGAPSFVSANDSRLGLRVGMNHATLSGPSDPEGAPTLQQGAAFDGLGVVGGVGSGLQIARLSQSMGLELELDIWVSAHSVSSVAESTSTDQRREVEFTTIILRAPLLVNMQLILDSWQEQESQIIRVGFGPTLLLGLSSGSTVTQDNIEGEAAPLFTTPVTHVGIEFGIGMDFLVSENFSIPLDLRFTYDPAVPSTTRERFDNFESNEAPGQYQVGLDYQLLFTVGFDYRLELLGES